MPEVDALEAQRNAFQQSFTENPDALDQIELMRQINLLADQLGMTPEAAQTLLLLGQSGLPASTVNQLLGLTDGDGDGGTGRTMFPEELALLREQAETERFMRDFRNRQLQEEQKQSAFERASNRIQLLQTTEQLTQERRENATAALLNALPYAVQPGTQYAPGFEPAGAAAQLSALVGAPYTAPRLPTANVNFGALAAGPEGAQTPQSIEASLAPLLNA